MVKELTFRCPWLEVRVRIGRPPQPATPLRWQRYCVASRDRTTALRESLLQRVGVAVKG